MRIATLAPARGLIRRIALVHARTNLERFCESLRSDKHGAVYYAPASVPAEEAERLARSAEAGAMTASILGCEELNCQRRAMPPYDPRAVCVAACTFLADDLGKGRIVDLFLGADVVPEFHPWPAAVIREAALDEAKRLKAGGEIASP